MFGSETQFVKWLGARMGKMPAGVRIGIGDDAAVVKLARGAELILKTDMSLEGVHFDPAIHPARSVGHRALARPLSDIAAMGGTPRFALISLAVSRSAGRRWLEGFYRGLLRLAKRYGVAIVGGDTAIVDRGMFVDVALIGEVKKGEALVRSGAGPGDLIYVSGRLGLSRLGLEALRWRAGFPAPPRDPSADGLNGPEPLEGPARRPKAWGRAELARAVKAHLCPEPRIALGRFLAEHHLASAAIDVSDGLSTDLGHLIAASGVGARIWASRVPAPILSRPASEPDERQGHRGGDSDSRRIAATTSRSSGKAQLAATAGPAPLDLALHGGEDYELLFTVPSRLAKRIPTAYRGVPLRAIGEIKSGRGMTIVNAEGREAPLRPGGFDHFSRARRR